MKSFFGLRSALLLGLCIGFLGCSESTTPADTAQVQIYTQLDGSSVTQSGIKNEAERVLKGVTADSLRISRVRILVSNLKLHLSKEDTSNLGHEVKAGPFLITIDSAGARLNATNSLPIGIYDRVKFEVHRFSSNEIATYLNDPVYSDFVTGDRYTIIVDGTVYNNGVAQSFTYKSNVTLNYMLKLDSDYQFEKSSTNSLILFFSPRLVFRSGTSVLDPRDPTNNSDIEKGIKTAFRVIKKLL
ncbi:MAG: hypothetical protein U0264_10000 [Candidatus Kapaibacterium sp.]